LLLDEPLPSVDEALRARVVGYIEQVLRIEAGRVTSYRVVGLDSERSGLPVWP
jgi:hypothetical protein